MVCGGVQYEKTVGRLEASYVIRKYLDAPRMPALASYLQVRLREAAPVLA